MRRRETRPTEGRYRYENVAVQSIYDGDTLTLLIDFGFETMRRAKFRLFGIDAPELKGKTRSAGLAAKAFLAELLNDRPVVLETIKDATEKYGRYLAKLYVGDVYVNDAMVAAGHAVPYFGKGPRAS